MKKIKFNFLKILTIMCFLLSIKSVNALQFDDFTNNLIPAEKFKTEVPEELFELYNEEKFYLTSDWLDENGDILPIISIDVKYIETTTKYGKRGKIEFSETKTISKEKYKNPPKLLRSSNCTEGLTDDCWETTYKKVFLSVINNGYPNVKVSLINKWKKIPAVKSFDNIGIYYKGFNLTNAYGYQRFNTASNQSEQVVTYGYNGTNMKNILGTGVSISQNLVDNTYNFLVNELWAQGQLTGIDGFNGSYQHAITDINLSTAKNFNFSGAGMGGVFNWNTSWSQWDGMQGVCRNLNSSYLWYC